MIIKIVTEVTPCVWKYYDCTSLGCVTIKDNLDVAQDFIFLSSTILPVVWHLFQVTAMNHVSTLTEHFNVTVDRLQPMANLTVKGVPDVVPQGSIQTLTTSVLVDMSVTATFRYEHRADRWTA